MVGLLHDQAVVDQGGEFEVGSVASRAGLVQFMTMRFGVGVQHVGLVAVLELLQRVVSLAGGGEERREGARRQAYRGATKDDLGRLSVLEARKEAVDHVLGDLEVHGLHGRSGFGVAGPDRAIGRA